MREATGDIVMLTEDHCVPGPHWVEELCLGVDNVAEIAGGGMDNAQREPRGRLGGLFLRVRSLRHHAE